MTKVLFLTQYPRQGPSPRYRVYQMLPWLQANGVECHTHSLVSEADYYWMRQRGRIARKSLAMSRSWLSRLNKVLHARDYDLVYVLKTAYPVGPPIFEKLLARSPTPFVLDYDDAIFVHRKSVDHGFLDRVKATHYFDEILKLADGVFVPNRFLHEYSVKHNSCVITVPEAEDTERITPRKPHSDDQPVVIGWVGSPSTVDYLDLVRPALQRLSDEFPTLSCRFVGGQWEDPSVRVTTVPWTLEKEVENFQSLDIGLMPLDDTPWSRGKSGCKLRQYMSAGVPSVASDVGYNQELIQNPSHGFLVKNEPEQWYGALKQLVESASLRNQISQAARKRVEDEFAIDRVGPKLKESMQMVIERAKRHDS